MFCIRWDMYWKRLMGLSVDEMGMEYRIGGGGGGWWEGKKIEFVVDSDM